MARKFFVGGNFKANGSVKSIQAILDNLNAASLDPNTGMFGFKQNSWLISLPKSELT